MGLLHDLKSWAYRKQLQKAIRTRPSIANKSHTNLDNAKQVGLIFDASAESTRRQVIQYADRLKKDGKQVFMLAYVEDTTQSEGFSFDTYGKKDLSWAGYPKLDAIDDFLDRPFDLLLHLEETASWHNQYIAAASKAALRVGPSTPYTDSYDLMIALKPDDRLSQLIKQIESLLSKTNVSSYLSTSQI